MDKVVNKFFRVKWKIKIQKKKTRSNGNEVTPTMILNKKTFFFTFVRYRKRQSL